jgi:CRISPR type III-A-associated RAMP protein Csm5
METLNKKYELQIEVLTPLHVGAGAEKDWVQGSDFIVDNNKVKILNLKKVSQFVNISDLTNALLNKDSKTLKSKLAGDIDKCVEKTFDGNYFGTNDIKTFIKNGLTNKPIVPGSSVKGAIRSVIAKHLLDGSKVLNEQSLFGKASDGDEFMRFIKISDAEFEQTNLVNTKIFNLLSVTEGGWKHDRKNTIKTFNKEGFNSFYEVIEPSQKTTMSIALAEKTFKNFGFDELYKNQKDKVANDFKLTDIEKQKQLKNIGLLAKSITPKSNIINSEINLLFKIINTHTKSYLEKEKAFFTKYSTDKTDKIIESIESLSKQIPKNGEYCILKMAAGSGFHCITGDWQFETFEINNIRPNGNSSRGQFNKNDSAKSRKIAIHGDKFELMGFVKLTTISEEDKRKMADEQAKKHQEIIKQQLEKEATERKEKERLKKIEDDRIEEENRLKKAESDAYQQALQLNTKQSYQDYLIAFPNSQNRSNIENKLSDLIKKTESDSYHQAIKIARKELYEKFISEYPLSVHKDEIAQLLSKLKAQSGIPERLLNLTESDKFFKESSAWIKKLPNRQLTGSGFEDEILNALKKIAVNELNDKKLAKVWTEGTNIKKLSNWIGNDQARLWFSEITKE